MYQQVTKQLLCMYRKNNVIFQKIFLKFCNNLFLCLLKNYC